MKTDGERGKLAGVRVVRPGLHELMIVSNFGTTIRIDADSVSRQGRAAQGVRVMNLRSGDSVSAIAKVISSRSADADGATDELTLDELSGRVRQAPLQQGFPNLRERDGARCIASAKAWSSARPSSSPRAARSTKIG